MDNQVFNKDDAYRTLDRINFWISNCDSKSSFILAFYGVFTPLLLTNSVTIDSVKSAVRNIQIGTFSWYSGTIIVISSLLMISLIICLLLGIINVILSLSAITRIKNITSNKLSIGSVIFFGSIANQSYDSYLEKLANANESSIFNDITSQIYINSKICSMKFTYFNKCVAYLKNVMLLFATLIVMYIISLY